MECLPEFCPNSIHPALASSMFNPQQLAKSHSRVVLSQWSHDMSEELGMMTATLVLTAAHHSAALPITGFFVIAYTQPRPTAS